MLGVYIFVTRNKKVIYIASSAKKQRGNIINIMLPLCDIYIGVFENYFRGILKFF